MLVAHDDSMNTKLLLKTILLIAILLLLVIMGMNNRQTVELTMPPILPKVQRLPAAIMYFGFFAIGVLAGTLLTAGKGSRGASKAKPEK
jgi:uncharacterized integral membrane protein